MGERRMERAVGYCRVSTAEQAASGAGVAGQRLEIEDYAARHGLGLVQVYVDEGVSARVPLDARPAGAKLCARLRQQPLGEPLHLIVPRLDRAFRSMSDLHAKLEEWGGGAVVLHLADVGLSTGVTGSPVADAMSQVMVAMIGAMAQLERTLAAERTRAAKRAARAKGLVIGPPRWGYKADRGSVVPDYDELAVMARAYSMVEDEGLSYREAADALNAAGVERKRGRGPWNKNAVMRVVKAMADEETLRMASVAWAKEKAGS